MTKREPFFAEGFLEAAFIFLMTAPIFVGPGILVWQSFVWLQSGQWPPLPVSFVFDYFGFSYPNTNWLGAQKIVNVILDLPLSVFSFVLWIAIVWLIIVMLNGRRERKERRN